MLVQRGAAIVPPSPEEPLVVLSRPRPVVRQLFLEELVERRDGYDVIRKRAAQLAQVAEETDPRS